MWSFIIIMIMIMRTSLCNKSFNNDNPPRIGILLWNVYFVKL
jgi:hypothetical protein